MDPARARLCNLLGCVALPRRVDWLFSEENRYAKYHGVGVRSPPVNVCKVLPANSFLVPHSISRFSNVSRFCVCMHNSREHSTPCGYVIFCSHLSGLMSTHSDYEFTPHVATYVGCTGALLLALGASGLHLSLLLCSACLQLLQHWQYRCWCYADPTCCTSRHHRNRAAVHPRCTSLLNPLVCCTCVISGL